MKNRVIRAAASAAIAAAALLAVPTAVQAATTEEYPDNTVATVNSPTIVAGGNVTFIVQNNIFISGETVNILLTGFNASAGSLAFAQFAASSETATLGTVEATPAGGASANVVLPSNATGTYEITAVGQESGTSVSATVSVAAAAGGDTLPSTGGDGGALLGLWVGGGALVLAGASIAVAGTVRRHRNAGAAA